MKLKKVVCILAFALVLAISVIFYKQWLSTPEADIAGGNGETLPAGISTFSNIDANPDVSFPDADADHNIIPPEREAAVSSSSSPEPPTGIDRTPGGIIDRTPEGMAARRAARLEELEARTEALNRGELPLPTVEEWRQRLAESAEEYLNDPASWPRRKPLDDSIPEYIRAKIEADIAEQIKRAPTPVQYLEAFDALTYEEQQEYITRKTRNEIVMGRLLNHEDSEALSGTIDGVPWRVVNTETTTRMPDGSTFTLHGTELQIDYDLDMLNLSKYTKAKPDE